MMKGLRKLFLVGSVNMLLPALLMHINTAFGAIDNMGVDPSSTNRTVHDCPPYPFSLPSFSAL
jgi:hypothetical protein